MSVYESYREVASFLEHDAGEEPAENGEDTEIYRSFRAVARVLHEEANRYFPRHERVDTFALPIPRKSDLRGLIGFLEDDARDFHWEEGDNYAENGERVRTQPGINDLVAVRRLRAILKRWPRQVRRWRPKRGRR